MMFFSARMRAEVFLASAVMLHLVGRGARSISEGRARNAENRFALEDCFPKHAQTLLFEFKGARRVCFLSAIGFTVSIKSQRMRLESHFGFEGRAQKACLELEGARVLAFFRQLDPQYS